MKIAKIVAREIFDSRGVPTVECDLFLDNGIFVCSSVPSGLSRSGYEAYELRDGGIRLMGQGMHRAVENIENRISPLLVGKEPDLITMDLAMLELDGTDNKSQLGANATLAVSIAVCRAQAIVNGMELYELLANLCDLESVALPFPMFNLFNAGVHADSGFPIQECMIMPIGAQNFRESMELAIVISHTLKKILKKNGKSTATGPEGGFVPQYKDEREAFDVLMEAIETCGAETQAEIVFALDVAASQLYDAQKNRYTWFGKQLTADDLIEKYMQLIDEYPIYSIEDGMSESDIPGWQKLMEKLGDTLQIVGDDLFATHPNRIIYGIEENLANAAIIKPNQIGTVTETLQAIKLCKDNDMNVIVSHRAGETNDTFIVDLAVGTSAGQIKAGGCNHGERMAKYNQLLKIEDSLMSTVLGF
jgi:enolase